MVCYDYKCAKCGHTWEYYQDNCKEENNPKKCPECGAKKPTRLFGAPAVHVFYSPMHPRYRRGMVSEPKKRKKA